MGALIRGKRHGQPVLIIGAGRGGVAMIELFQGEEGIRIVGVADRNPEASGLSLARQLNINTYLDLDEALRACGQCFVINLTHEEKVSEKAASCVGVASVMGGQSAKLFWMMVTRLKSAGDELQRSRDKLHAMIQFAVDGIVITDTHGTIATFNRAAEKMFGYKENEIVGNRIDLLLPEETRSKIALEPDQMIDLNCHEVEGRRKDGSIFPMDISANILQMAEGKYFVGIFRDISERKAIEEKIRFMAQFDHLTGLSNRHRFYEHLEWAIKNAKRHDKKLAALFLDLDGFKQVNDMHGHEAGDKLLIEVASRLQACVRESDSVARTGGDEFIVLLTDINDVQSADIVAIKILEAMCKPVAALEDECQIGVSIGIAFYPDDAKEADTLVCMADDAMYLAKNNGKNNIKHYSDISASKFEDVAENAGTLLYPE